MSSRRRAISMIDLTLVLLIVGITAAIAAPRFMESIRTTKLQVAARQLAAHIDYIRRVAVNEARTTTLVCNNTLHSYASGEVDFPDRPGQLLNVAIRDVYDPQFELIANFDSQTTLSFDFEGVPHVASTPLVNGKITIALGGNQFEVRIAPGTGETSVVRTAAVDKGWKAFTPQALVGT